MFNNSSDIVTCWKHFPVSENHEHKCKTTVYYYHGNITNTISMLLLSCNVVLPSCLLFVVSISEINWGFLN